MKAMKKLLSIMLVALLLVSAVPFQAAAAEAIGYKYTIKIEGYAMEVIDGNGTVTAAELGLMAGIAEDEFGVGQPVTREQLATVVVKLYEILSK